MIDTRALARYASWQLRDALGKALVPLGIFTFIGGIPIWLAIRNNGLQALRSPGRLQEFALQQYHGALPLALALGAILLMSGGASLDRERQHVRFLFSRPVTPWLLYLQQFVLATALFATVVTLIPLLFSWIVVEVPVRSVVMTALLFAGIYGSLGFLCGALMNRDGIAFIGIMIVSQVLQAAERADQLGRTWSAIANALPPLATAGAIRADWFAGRAADAGDLQLVLGYSLGMLAAALLLVRHRPLVR